ncbi:ABC transporter ATP-binding protein [Vallitalea okinawensis]|uniref:ABC transporter ATP-binding protein n=1 Tax=Vallitalea okinawensis TaxID=2078660 RepID=UPI000CFBE4A2|nr:ABC transporter ATP-binding protein [Vallitalea okinawensis]
MVQVNNLYHSYTKDDNYAVENVSFDIKKGEIFGFLGPSGAGKSTTQMILTGLLQRQQGDIIIDGTKLIKPGAEYFNQIGVSFERANVYRQLSGYDNLAFHAKMFDVETIEPGILLEQVGLLDDQKKKAGKYSKGMLQRLVFARSMINRPKLWFLDEPTSGLDPNTASNIKGIIRQKQQEGSTIFLTTHNMYIADELCDRVALIVDGKISMIDTPKNLKLQYGDQYVAVEYKENNRLMKENLHLNKQDQKQRLNNIMMEKEILTVHSGEPTLEEVFLRVTGRGLE